MASRIVGGVQQLVRVYHHEGYSHDVCETNDGGADHRAQYSQRPVTVGCICFLRLTGQIYQLDILQVLQAREKLILPLVYCISRSRRKRLSLHSHHGEDDDQGKRPCKASRQSSTIHRRGTWMCVITHVWGSVAKPVTKYSPSSREQTQVVEVLDRHSVEQASWEQDACVHSHQLVFVRKMSPTVSSTCG